jgi:hypothetical protein
MAMMTSAQWSGVPRNVHFLLRAFSLHEIDHVHVVAQRPWGRTFGEALRRA